LKTLGLNLPVRERDQSPHYHDLDQPFGQTGPYKDYKGGELVATHLGGVGYLSTREGDPMKEP